MINFFKQTLNHPGYSLVGLALVLTLIWLGMVYYFVQKAPSLPQSSLVKASVNKELLKQTLQFLETPASPLPDFSDPFQ